MPQLASNLHCTGCTACVAICPQKCITMNPDPDGFSYPLIDRTACVDCGSCEKVCPILTSLRPSHEPTAYAAMSKDLEMRMDSSSGGIFTELSRQILSQNGAVFGAVYDEEFQVCHSCSEDEKTLATMRGAKYAQSDLGGVFLEVKDRLGRGQQVLFSGTPCQVEGLLSYLGKPFENLITVDFVCHSVPSPMAWREYVHSLGDVQNINQRAKDTGWSRYKYCSKIVDSQGAVRVVPNAENLYMKLLVGNYISRPSCAKCHFKGYARKSDLTIGDFWGIWDSYPDMDDNRGTSVVLVQSEKGSKLWESICTTLKIREVTLDEASAQNKAMLMSATPAAKKALVWTYIRNSNFAACEEMFQEKKVTLYQKIYGKLLALLHRITES